MSKWVNVFDAHELIVQRGPETSCQSLYLLPLLSSSTWITLLSLPRCLPLALCHYASLPVWICLNIDTWGDVIHVPVCVCDVGKLNVDRTEAYVNFKLLRSPYLNLGVVSVINMTIILQVEHLVFLPSPIVLRVTEKWRVLGRRVLSSVKKAHPSIVFFRKV